MADKRNFDMEAYPFGFHAPTDTFMAIRSLVLSKRPPKFVRTWLYKLFSHFTKAPEMVLDLEYRGLKLRLFPGRNSGDRWIVRQGRHPEEHDFSFFDPFKGKDAVFVDIGANVGVYSMVACQALGPGARVLAFEPHPETREKLSFHLVANAMTDRVEIVPMAVGAEESVLKLYVVTERDEGSHSLNPPGGDTHASSVNVAVRPLLNILRERGVERVDLLKIDIEGAEDKALAPFYDNAPEDLWPKDVLIEVLNAGAWERDVVAELKALGYRVLEETHGNLKLTRRPT